MAIVDVELAQGRYAVVIESGGLDRLGERVRSVAPAARAALVADRAVLEPHAARAHASLERAGYAVERIAVDGGEEQKTLDLVRTLYDSFLAAKLERAAPVIALGGGVIGDSVGFAAATYLRGVPFVQCPTTLLAMVDSSVGGKVGVNVPQGKNLVGAFYQPEIVVADPRTLSTLPARELRAGLAECIKHAIIRDPALFAWTRANLSRVLALDPAAIEELVARNVAIKAAVVAADPLERGERAHLNFGHTFGHAIEAATAYGTFLHGEGVALGMVAASALSAELGLVPRKLADEVRDAIAAADLPVRAALPPDDALAQAMALDKKVAKSRIRFVLIDRLGHALMRDDVPPEAVRKAWAAIRA